MTRERLREILVDELEKETGLPPGADDHIDALRRGEHHASPGLRSVLRAMELAVREVGGM